MDKQIELEASEALLDVGVSVPLKAIRIPFIKKKIVWRLTMKRPCLWNMVKIARLYLQMNVTADQMRNFTKEEEMAFIAVNGSRISRMVALTICRDGISGQILYRPLSWFIHRMVQNVFLQGAFTTFVSLMGTRAFMPIINSVEIANPMKPKLSHKMKGS